MPGSILLRPFSTRRLLISRNLHFTLVTEYYSLPYELPFVDILPREELVVEYV